MPKPSLELSLPRLGQAHRPCLGMRAKLLILVLLILVPLLALQGIGIYGRLTRYRRQELQASHELAQATSAAFLNYLENLWDAQQAMGAAITGGLPPTGIERYLKAQLPAHPTVSGFAWVSPEGIVLESTTAGSRGISCADREHVRRVVAGEDKVVANLVQNRVTGQPTFFVARAIRDGQRRLLGLMVASIHPARLGLVLPVERTGRSNLGLIDGNGVGVYRSNDPKMHGVGTKIREGTPGWRALKTGQLVLSREYTSSFDQTRRMGAFIPMPTIGWVAGVTAQVDEVLAAAWQEARRDAAVLLVVTAVSLLGALVLGQTFLKPLHALEQAALAVSRGDLKARVPLSGRDEVATAARAFNQMADRIMDLEADRTRFLETAAHALRNPMSAAKGACALLRQRLKGGEEAGQDSIKALTILEHEVDRLSSLLDEVLDAFCLREGRLFAWREPVDLSDVVKRALEPFQVLNQDHRFAFEEKGAARVFGDARRLEEVVRSLVSNAVKFSPPGSEVRVSAEVDGPRAVLTVQDQGFGIPRDELDKVFHSFYRGSNLEGRDPGSLGLGLYISNMIVADHGGRIQVDSEEGRGTTVRVELPRLSTL